MRKRYDQVSTLHVIHHGIMPVSVWWGVKFTPGGHSTFFGFLNTFVHIFMYAYYMLAAMGPKVQKYLWWKKYLTVMQMIQFVLVMVHSFQLFFKNDCNYPIGFAYFIGAHAVMFYFLFSNFYKRAYVKRDGKVSSLYLIDVGRFYQKRKICIKQSSVKLLGLKNLFNDYILLISNDFKQYKFNLLFICFFFKRLMKFMYFNLIYF